MTYKKIYNKLERAGLIEKLMVESNWDKVGIIKGIEYLEYFLSSSTFADMKYWKDAKCNKTLALVCQEYAKLEIENKNKHIDKYEYMLQAMLQTK